MKGYLVIAFIAMCLAASVLGSDYERRGDYGWSRQVGYGDRRGTYGTAYSRGNRAGYGRRDSYGYDGSRQGYSGNRVGYNRGWSYDNDNNNYRNYRDDSYSNDWSSYGSRRTGYGRTRYGNGGRRQGGYARLASTKAE